MPLHPVSLSFSAIQSFVGHAVTILSDSNMIAIHKFKTNRIECAQYNNYPKTAEVHKNWDNHIQNLYLRIYRRKSRF